MRKFSLLIALCVALFHGHIFAAPPVPPYIGVSYYPEVAGTQIDEDIARMKSLGINLVRFGDFSWSRMETNDGQFNFAWLHEAVDKFAAAGIAVELCTPTAAPPIWLTEAHPDVLRVSADGQPMQHGGRRHYCPNSEMYRAYASRIAEKLSTEFGDAPGVVAWQVDNELFGDCYCTNCEKVFHAWLKDHFGTVEKLNAAWLTVLWSQEYQSFDQVPLPNSTRSSPHPSLAAAYRKFMSDSYVSFCNAEASALRKHTRRPITTNAHNPAAQQIDQAELFRGLDLVCMDSYAGPNDLLRYAFECDWMRALNKPFWLAETASSHSAGTAVADTASFEHLPGALRAKMWLTFALGGEAVSFWLWRAHWAAQELEHGSVIYPWGDDSANTPEIRRVADELNNHAAWLRATKPKPASVALFYSMPAQWQFTATPIAAGFRYDSAIAAYHRLLRQSGANVDLVMPGCEYKLDAYQTVFTPYTPSFSAETLSRLEKFVEAGGTWVLGPLSACRNEETAAHRDASYGADLEKWLGIHVRHRMTPGGVTRLASNSEMINCRWWCDAFVTNRAQKVLANYSGSALDGFAAVVECRIGKGRVILFGTQPEETWLAATLKPLLPQSSMKTDEGTIVVERISTDGKPAGCIAVNTRSTLGKLLLPNGLSETLESYAVKFYPK